MSVIPEDIMAPATGFSSGMAALPAIVVPTLLGYLIQVSGFGAVVLFVALASIISGLCTLPLVKKGY